MSFKLSYKSFGEQAILVEWPKQILETILEDVLGFKEKINVSDVENIQEVRSAYQSLLIVFNDTISFETEVVVLKSIYNSEEIVSEIKSNIWRVPVCYDDVFGLDLNDLSETKNLSKSEIVKRHTQVLYTVYFIGFLPGFLYLGGLDETLSTPRKAMPRMVIEKGAVAIGGNQTGIYPSQSPGGWNIIGQTPVDFFNPNLKPPCFAKSGDRIQFYGVSLKEYNDIKILVDAEVYQIESEVRHD
ncbi:5-oxoprolinase subunit PxpB [Tamlana sp. 2_MG-2023]|uniref:5-oxoprolinase subunit PxpB n=1 Tax=unclassified Tamlana TaxID=2614803 RepID=UPI0026E28E89|nr:MULTISPECIES: 5-oxoprolinase subunit PxpB [unclassified Tamlana]MDO6758859.1 5-oxoprolinase subunit PxpB [Tamlana sp. 2_MG-2023]MDO6789558.1 5-oxoprolinase subunit PxpB [Tamlana sp. 1_MG-2023]